jgi:FkbM family methyltransferase
MAVEIMIEKTAANRAEGNVDRVVRQRFFRGQDSGIFVEVGAARPDYLSISALYRALGWAVIAIEPNPEFCELHRKRGHEVLEYACGNRDEDGVDFCIVNSHGAEYEGSEVTCESFSSLAIKDSYAKLGSNLDIRKVTVNLRRLDTILRTHAPNIHQIDLLSVDVEGWELEVLDGLDFTVYSPRVMVIENMFHDKKYREYMRAKGYGLWRCIGPNDIYTTAHIGFWERLGYSFYEWICLSRDRWIVPRLNRLRRLASVFRLK